MRWFMVPVSICAHVVLAALLVIVPLAAEDEWPRPAPLPSFMLATKVVPVPPQMIPRVAHRPPPSVGVTAPSSIGPERDTPPEPTGPSTPGAPPDVAGGPIGIGVPDGFGTPIAVPLPPPPPPVEPPAPRRVGGEVREPKKILDFRPVYPPFAQAAKVEGMVILEAVINERGGVERLKLLRSAPLLDAAAIEAVRKWRYTPTLLNGTPVSVLMTITVHFKLHD